MHDDAGRMDHLTFHVGTTAVASMGESLSRESAVSQVWMDAATAGGQLETAEDVLRDEMGGGVTAMYLRAGRKELSRARRLVETGQTDTPKRCWSTGPAGGCCWGSSTMGVTLGSG